MKSKIIEYRARLEEVMRKGDPRDHLMPDAALRWEY
jgi:hypothetical protein